MRVDFRRKLTLTGELVTLRPGGGSDAALLAGLLNDREVLCLTGAVHSSNERGKPPWTPQQFEEIYDRWSIADDRIVWVIFDNATGSVVGSATGWMRRGSWPCHCRGGYPWPESSVSSRYAQAAGS